MVSLKNTAFFSRRWSMVGIGVVLTTLFLTVIVSRQPQEIRQHAAGVSATAIPTYQSIGLYWSPADGSAANQGSVQYRIQGATTWKQGYPLWYDGRAVGGRPAEYRGSIVLLQPGTTYEIQLTLTSGTT